MANARFWPLVVGAALLAVPALAQDPAPAADAEAKLDEIHGRLEGMTEQIQTLQTDTDRLRKIKFSGYVQARWETADNSSDTVKVSGSPATLTPANVSRFYVRRGRLKMTYDSSPLNQAVAYIDGGQDRGIRLLEAYVTTDRSVGGGRYEDLKDNLWTVQFQHKF